MKRIRIEECDMKGNAENCPTEIDGFVSPIKNEFESDKRVRV